MTATANTNTIRFTLKDAGRESLATAIYGILSQEAIYDGIESSTHSAGGYIVNCSSRQRNTKGGIAVNIRFSLNSGGRRAFANAIGEVLGIDAVYAGTPTFAYVIGSYTVERDGALTFPNNIFHRESVDLIIALRERGYEVETDEIPGFHTLQMTEREELELGRNRPHDRPCDDDSPPSDVPEPYNTTELTDKLVIDMPRVSFSLAALSSLQKIIASKKTLIKKALGADDLPLVVTEDKISFPWFTLTGADGEMDAYLRFVTALCEMAKRQKRVTAKEQEVTNDKFTFRVFLIRLGFVGSEFKMARKILLRNLSGNSSWKGGHPPAQTDDSK